MNERQNPVSICIICKNEEKHIETFLNSICRHFNNYPTEIVLVDTGSEDKTLEIISQFTNNSDINIKLFHFKWINDFATARNFSLSQASNDWVLILDCDEYIDDLDIECFGQMISQCPYSVGILTRRNHQKQSGTDSIYTDQVERFFNKTYFHYESQIHEQVRIRPQYVDELSKYNNIIRANPNEAFSRVSIPLSVEHYGYIGTPEEIQAKVSRNNEQLFKMLEVTPEDAYIFFQLGQSYNLIQDYEKAAYYYGKGLECDVNPDYEYVQMMVESYGYTLLNLEKYTEALQFENIEDIFGKTPEFAVLLGIIYLRNGMLENAVSQFFKATTYPDCHTEGANSFIPCYNLGCINEVLGNIEDAVTLYKKCGVYPPALNRLQELCK